MTVERLVLLTGIAVAVLAVILTLLLARLFGFWGVVVVPPIAGALYVSWLRARDHFSYLDQSTLRELREK